MKSKENEELLLTILGHGALMEGFLPYFHSIFRKSKTICTKRGVQSKEVFYSLNLDQSWHNEKKNLPEKLYQSTHILFTPPPTKLKRGGAEVIKEIISDLNDKKFCGTFFLCSSISVYGTKKEKLRIDESHPTQPQTQSAKDLVLMERQLASANFPSVILRLGGLYGGERHPIHTLITKEKIEGANQRVNLLHHLEFHQIFCQLLTLKTMPEELTILNMVNDISCSKEKFYNLAAKLKTLAGRPKFLAQIPEVLPGGKIDNSKIKELTGFKFERSLII